MDKFYWLLLGVAGGAIIVYLVLKVAPTIQLQQSKMFYKNEEKWQVQRDSSGRLIGLTVHREANEQ